MVWASRLGANPLPDSVEDFRMLWQPTGISGQASATKVRLWSREIRTDQDSRRRASAS